MTSAWLEFVRDPVPWSPPSPLPGAVFTARTQVRRYRPGDGTEVFRAIDASRPALLPWMAWARTDHRTTLDSEAFVQRAHESARRPDCTDFVMGIFERPASNEGAAQALRLVGGTGLQSIRADLRQAEVGYWLTGARRGEGICTEAVGALMTQAFVPEARGGWGFRRLVVFSAVTNTRSRRVCERLGLRLEMRMRQERYLGPEGQDGAPGYHDVVGFAVLASEWDFERQRAHPGIEL